MGQVTSISDTLIPDTMDTVHYEVKKHAKILSEIRTLSYDDFQKCLVELNELSRKCLDPNGKQLVFAVRKGTDASMLWKATVQIACVKVDPQSRQIENYNFLNLKQFIQVFKTFQSHLQVLMSSEQQKELLTSSMLIDKVNNIANGVSHKSINGAQTSTSAAPLNSTETNECCICLDRKPDVILPCTHTYCCPCIEQWNMSNKTCPMCQQEFKSTDDSWVLSELPDVHEINEKICTELMELSKAAENN